MQKIFRLTILFISSLALAGGALGAATGAIVGATTAPPPPPPPPGYYGAPPPPRCARFGYDAYGNQFCMAYYGY